MEKNKTGKYFKYAIGEIILVVIGILIALQINTWKTEYENKKVVIKNCKTLIKNLEKDSVYMTNVLQAMKSQNDKLLDFEQRLSEITATIDTVIKIARYEFEPVVQTIEFPNENEYNTMIISGEINLFDREITQDIYDLYSQHQFLDKVSQENFELFVRAVETFNNNYSLDSSITTIKGHLQDELWQDVNAKDLIAKFDKILLSKRIQFGRQKDLERVLKENHLLLTKLREIENK
jgi:NDP-sugar pyrophosphorylase family protein